MKKFLFMLLAFASFNVSAECWVVSNFKGEFSSGQNEWKFRALYKPVYTLHITIDGKKADIAAGPGTQEGEPRTLTILNEKALSSYRSNQGVTEIETFAIQDEKVLYNSTIQNTHTSAESGVITMVGDITAKC